MTVNIARAWPAFRVVVDANPDAAVFYAAAQGNYYVYTSTTAGIQYSCVMTDDSEAAVDFVANYKDGRAVALS